MKKKLALLIMAAAWTTGTATGVLAAEISRVNYEREFITLCTIAGNGHCRGQLGGHVNGNLSVGHLKNMLRAAMLYNGEINGREKTDLVLDVIDTVPREVNACPKAGRPQPVQGIAEGFKSDSEECK